MRKVADSARIRAFMSALGRDARGAARVYFTGGATAVLLGWRATTIDVDIHMEPESDALLRAIPSLKEALKINVELACPSDFIPELPGWKERSLFVAQQRKLSFHHYDLYSQALSKIERRHRQDLDDVREMIASGRIEPKTALEYFSRIEPQLYRYPAIDPA